MHMYMFFPIQLEYNKDFLTIYNTSNDDTDMIAKMTGKMNESEVSVQGNHNQLLVVFTTNEDIGGNGFYGLIKQGKFFNYLTPAWFIHQRYQSILFYTKKFNCIVQ